VNNRSHTGAKSAATNTPFFRLCLTIAILWMVGFVSYSIFTGWFVDLVHQAANQRIEAGCRFSPQPIYCEAAEETVKSDWELFW
jgi:hypothetical protein